MEMYAVVFGDHLTDAGEGIRIGITCVNDDRLVDGYGSGELTFKNNLLSGMGEW